MAQRSSNTPVELWPKVLKALLDVREAAAEGGLENYQRDLDFSLRIEGMIMDFRNQPVMDMLGGFDSPGAGGQPFSPGQGGGQAQMMGGPPPPSMPPNPDELRRAMTPGP